MLVALVAGNMIGSGVFLLPASLARIGYISLFSLLATIVGALALTWVFARLSIQKPMPGGPFVYVKEGLGDFFGLQSAYGYWLAAIVGNAAIAVAVIGYASVFLPELNQSTSSRIISLLAVVWSLTWLNMSSQKGSGWFQIITTILRLVPLALVSCWGLMHFHLPENFELMLNVTGKSSVSAFGNGTLITMWLFLGLEAATVPDLAVEDPKRDVPLASLLGVIIASIIYVLTTVAMFGSVPIGDLAHSSAPFVLAGEKLFGAAGKWIIMGGALVACVGALNGWVMVAAQLPQTAVEHGYFPKLFASKKAGQTSKSSLLISSGITSIILVVTTLLKEGEQLDFLITLATMMNVVIYLYVTTAGFILMDKGYFAEHKIESVVFTLAFCYSLYAVVGCSADLSWPAMAAMVLFGILGYVALLAHKQTSPSKALGSNSSLRRRRRRSRFSKQQEEQEKNAESDESAALRNG